MRKTILMIVIALFATLNLYPNTTEGGEKSSEPQRELTVLVTNKNGKPMKNAAMYMFHSEDFENVRMPNAEGEVTFYNVTNNGILNVLFHDNLYSMPIDSAHSITLVRDRRTLQGSTKEEIEKITHNELIPEARDYIVSRVKKDYKMDDMDKYQNLADYIQANVSGVHITNDNGYYTITLRGISSFTLTNEPLIIVNGTSYANFNSAVNNINIKHIESVRVDKSGSAYGMRGANGAIIIRTKRTGDSSY